MSLLAVSGCLKVESHWMGSISDDWLLIALQQTDISSY